MKITFSISSSQNKDVALVALAKKQDEKLVALLPSGQKQILIGIKEPEKMNRRQLISLAREVVSLAKSHKLKKIAINFSEWNFPKIKVSDRELAEILATNWELANFEFNKYKTKPKEGWNLVEEVIVSGKINNEIKKGFERGQLIGGEVNGCRTLANTPGGEMTPTLLAQETKKAVKGTKVKVKVLDVGEMKGLGMGGILGVSKGSDEEPRFIIMEYLAGKKNDKPVVLVGKGVTFDTGGLNLKPSDGIYEMHMDMSGGAAVIHAISLAAKLGLKKNVMGLIPAAENMPSGSSYHPGDVLKTMSGKTIEVLNTDAEGRIILADALTYAKKYNPKLVVDVATLTGAALVALGNKASAIFSKDEKILDLLQKLGEESGDYVWPLPLWDEYAEDIKGTFGDVANTGKGRNGGAITGAMFLQQFVEDYKWAHIDIAPRMTARDEEFLIKGATGEPVRLLIKLLERV